MSIFGWLKIKAHPINAFIHHKRTYILSSACVLFTSFLTKISSLQSTWPPFRCRISQYSQSFKCISFLFPSWTDISAQRSLPPFLHTEMREKQRIKTENCNQRSTIILCEAQSHLKKNIYKQSLHEFCIRQILLFLALLSSLLDVFISRRFSLFFSAQNLNIVVKLELRIIEKSFLFRSLIVALVHTHGSLLFVVYVRWCHFYGSFFIFSFFFYSSADDFLFSLSFLFALLLALDQHKPSTSHKLSCFEWSKRELDQEKRAKNREKHRRKT